MKLYEGSFIFFTELNTDAKTQQLKTLEETLKKFGGQFREKNDLGRRSLGYPIKKQREGNLFCADFELDPAQMQEFRKALQLFEGLLTSMILVKNIKAEKKPKVKPIPATTGPGKPSSQPRVAGTAHPSVTTH